MKRLARVRRGVVFAAASLVFVGCGTTAVSNRVMPAGMSAPSESAHVRDCAPAQLTMKYYGADVGTGNNFGTIAVLNHSRTACSWRGSVSVVPLDRNQQIMGDNAQAIANAHAMTASVVGILLSAHGYVVDTQPAPAGDHWGELQISGDARDDPRSSNGMCSKTNQVTPAYWGIATLGQKFTVANDDPRNRGGDHFGGATACRGIFNRIQVSASP